MSKEVEMIKNVCNCPVVQVAGRQYPGIVIQGDSLSILVGQASEIVRLLKMNDFNNVKDAGDELLSNLSGYLKIYTDTLREHNLSAPF